MKILLGDFSAKVSNGDILKATIGDESLHEVNDHNGVRVVNFVTYRNPTIKSKMFPHCKIHKCTWMSPDGKAHNQINILIDR
jgi:hypothetical protein